jgi:hypothetical protein
MTYSNPGPNVPYGSNPNYDPRMARAAQLTESARNWLIICGIGWFVGFMWITGPLAWYQATQFARDFQTMGLAPPSEVTNLRLLGIITTAFVLVGFFIGMAILAAVLIGVFSFGGISHP